jgi:hypothetical protein
LIHFNEIATEIIIKNKCELNPLTLKIYESEVDINMNCLVSFEFIEADLTSKNAKNWVIPMYQYQANLIRLCIENSKPCMLYGDVGIGKTTLIEVSKESKLKIEFYFQN